MTNRFLVLSLAVFLLASNAAYAAISVAPTTDGTMLASTLAGGGVTISNVSLSGGATSAGTFLDGTSAGIGIESGIILTSGDAALAIAPNNEDGATGSWGISGDSDLNGLVPQSNTYDACVLEFDFTSIGTAVYFNYVFASEEYNEYTNSNFNDVFGFFLDGVNIAKLPDGVTNVSINTVNGGNPYGTAATNPQWFNNNDLQDGGPYFALQYDGFTDKFLATGKGLTVGETYHLKLAIADTSDSVLDSAVFLEAGTFSNELPEDPGIGEGTGVVPEPTTLIIWSVLGAIGLVWSRRR